jgi:type VII secretion integral membrane protein EccD
VATGTTVFSRVTVVAPKTRIDLALPADVSVADLLPMLLEMARETTADGGSRHGGWCLARLGGEPLEPSQTLAALGIVDGDLLQLRRRSDDPPPPLYDDVVDALAEAEPGSYRPWTKETAAKIGNAAGGLGLVAAAAALGLGGLSGGIIYHVVSAVVGLAVAVFATGIGSIVTRTYGASTTGTVIAAAGGLPMAFAAGLCVVPGPNIDPALLLASALVLIFSAVSIMVIGAGIVTFISTATLGAFATLTFLIATVINTQPEEIAGLIAAVALAGISLLPRITIQLANLPLPQVPTNADELREETRFPDYQLIEYRSGLAHQYMTGLIIGCGLAAAVGAVASAFEAAVVSSSAEQKIFGPVLAVVVTAVLLLRGRSYANSSQAVALLVSGLLAAAGAAIGLIVVAPPIGKLAWVFPPLLVLSVLAIVFGVVFPNRRFSPVQRRSVDILEAILIAAVLPLALGAVDLYDTIRDLNLNLF